MESTRITVGALLLVAIAIQPVLKRPSDLDRFAYADDDEKISVTEASYGKNQRPDQSGNATEILSRECDGKWTCHFAVGKAASQVGDHSPGLAKDFDYVYVCGHTQHEGHVDGESDSKVALLTCDK